LPGYALRTTVRMLAALVASFIFTFTYATAAGKSRRAEMVLIPPPGCAAGLPSPHKTDREDARREVGEQIGSLGSGQGFALQTGCFLDCNDPGLRNAVSLRVEGLR
jgi:hypothetical protein